MLSLTSVFLHSIISLSAVTLDSSTGIILELVRNTNLEPHPRITELESATFIRVAKHLNERILCSLHKPVWVLKALDYNLNCLGESRMGQGGSIIIFYVNGKVLCLYYPIL